MSHYCVAVFCNEPDDMSFDELLAPYSETDEKYMEFVPSENLEERYQKYKEKNPETTMDFEEFAEDYCGCELRDGIWGRVYNPNAKWDWYTLDGREDIFENIPGQKPEGNYYRYRKNQLNFYPKIDLTKESIFWDHYVEQKPIPEGSEPPCSFFKREFYLERYGSKEQYLKEMGTVTPYAFVTPDGEWHAPGNMGWFACSDETAESTNEYIEEWYMFINSSDNPYVSFVDCHI